jgi:hypothetical protein
MLANGSQFECYKSSRIDLVENIGPWKEYICPISKMHSTFKVKIEKNCSLIVF